MSYDKNNIFAKILRGEITCRKVYENEYVLSFYDINPQKKIHVLVIPKGEYIDLDNFINKGSDKEIVELNKAIIHIVKMLKISNREGGYRVLSNIGKDGGQEVPHLHYHIFGGEKIGKMVV
jgi:histidine triad (HIT) family protein|tara:strand:- start:4513 stop:4875 length:363 start_codon:yes stop_codon:yes gene_type:complete